MRGADLGRLSTLPSDAEPPPHIRQRETWAPVREEVVSLESPEVPTMGTDTQAAPPWTAMQLLQRMGWSPLCRRLAPEIRWWMGKSKCKNSSYSLI